MRLLSPQQPSKQRCAGPRHAWPLLPLSSHSPGAPASPHGLRPPRAPAGPCGLRPHASHGRHQPHWVGNRCGYPVLRARPPPRLGLGRRLVGFEQRGHGGRVPAAECARWIGGGRDRQVHANGRWWHAAAACAPVATTRGAGAQCSVKLEGGFVHAWRSPVQIGVQVNVLSAHPALDTRIRLRREGRIADVVCTPTLTRLSRAQHGEPRWSAKQQAHPRATRSGSATVSAGLLS